MLPRGTYWKKYSLYVRLQAPVDSETLRLRRGPYPTAPVVVLPHWYIPKQLYWTMPYKQIYVVAATGTAVRNACCGMHQVINELITYSTSTRRVNHKKSVPML